jgi:hypothetical protein
MIKAVKILRILIVLLLIVQTSIAQDSSFHKKHLTSADIEVFYSFYTQDGDHSAVTGGTGTEKLHVHNAGFNASITRDSSHTIIVEAYIDAITSASTDKIDFVMSSASREDNHISAHLGYQFNAKKLNFVVGGKYMFGLESDFLSHGFNIWTSFGNRIQTNSFSLSLACFFDDLRWGRLSPTTGFKPTTLIYPSELRYKQWFDVYRRNSYNLNFGFRQDINRRVTIHLDLGLIYQRGLLSTPFHRMYFMDSDSIKIENLPRERLQFPLGIGLNVFLSPIFILKAYYSFFTDDFGIKAHTINIEVPVRFGYTYSLYPFFRIYHQTAARYFKPYKEHLLPEIYYTSDYDLSAFWSYKAGLGFGFYPDKRFGKSHWSFNNMIFRYAYYWRTDQLDAHMVSILFNIRKD